MEGDKVYTSRVIANYIKSHYISSQVISVFEGMQQGRIHCSAVLDESVFLTAGESTVSDMITFTVYTSCYMYWYMYDIGCLCMENESYRFKREVTHSIAIEAYITWSYCTCYVTSNF